MMESTGCIDTRRCATKNITLHSWSWKSLATRWCLPRSRKQKQKSKTPVPGVCSTHAKKGSMQTCSRMPTRQSRLSPSSARVALHVHKLNKFALSLECDCRLVCSTWSEGCTIIRFRNPPPPFGVLYSEQSLRLPTHPANRQKKGVKVASTKPSHSLL